MVLLKKNITKDQFVDFFLEIRSRIEKEVIKFFKDDLEYKGDEKKLQYEAMIFALWLTTLGTPPNNKEIKDMLHSAFFLKYWGVENNEPLLKQIDKRYKNYYAAFNMWQRNPQSGHMIGSVMIEIMTLKLNFLKSMRISMKLLS